MDYTKFIYDIVKRKFQSVKNMNVICSFYCTVFPPQSVRYYFVLDDPYISQTHDCRRYDNYLPKTVENSTAKSQFFLSFWHV